MERKVLVDDEPIDESFFSILRILVSRMTSTLLPFEERMALPVTVRLIPGELISLCRVRKVTSS